jgi:hypothetical protein
MPQNAMTGRAVHSTTLRGHSSRLSAAPFQVPPASGSAPRCSSRTSPPRKKRPGPSSQAHYPFRAYLAWPRASARIRQDSNATEDPVLRASNGSQLKGRHNTERRVSARSSRVLRVVGCIAVPGYGPADSRTGCMFQPVAQTLANASAPQDLALPWAGVPDIGVEKVLVPFTRQAGLCTAALGANIRFCRSECNDRPRSSCCADLGSRLFCLPGGAQRVSCSRRPGFAGSPETKSSPRCTQPASASSAA